MEAGNGAGGAYQAYQEKPTAPDVVAECEGVHVFDYFALSIYLLRIWAEWTFCRVGRGPQLPGHHRGGVAG